MVGLTINVKAQTALFGQIDTADLKMTACDFEKEANAMVLFNVATVKYNNRFDIVMERHKRVKIFNDKSLELANVKLTFLKGYEDIKDVEAETINLNGNKIERTVIDKKLMYSQKVDKDTRAIIFAFPNVKSGSVIEVKYTWKTSVPYNYPNWVFQDMIPTRYSAFNGAFIYNYHFNIIRKLTQHPVIDTTYKAGDIYHKWVLTKIPGFRLEAYMNSIEDNLQSVYFRPNTSYFSWTGVALRMLADEDYGKQLDLPLDNEAQLINDANELSTKDEKIAFLFNTIKNTIKWNNIDQWYSNEGLKKVWQKKTGNSTEINLLLYHFLKRADVKPTLLALGTRDNGELETDNPSFGRINKSVVRVAIDSLNFYILDASGKYNTYSDTPYELLGLNMLPIEDGYMSSGLLKFKTGVASKEFVLINGDIKPDGKLEGDVQLSSSNYKRISKLVTYDKLGEKKYLDETIKENNNNLDISAYKMMNMEVDTLPLREDFKFKLELTGSDENYIFLSSNLFTGLSVNPFLSEKRLSDIDFIFPNIYSINARYKVPAGYKVDVLPKSLNVVMGDNSISFKRVIGEMEGAVVMHYIIDFKKTKYTRDEYPELRAFYKKMYEMLNEQIVLKKG